MSEQESASTTTIVVAHDGSLVAQHAASIAIHIASRQRRQIRGVYVKEAAMVLDPYPSYQAEWSKTESLPSHSERLSQFEERGQMVCRWLELQCRAAHVAATTAMVFGSVPTVVQAEAATAVLLALGRRGHGHLASPHHLGWHFRAIAHQTRQPLLVGGDGGRPVQRVLLAYNEGDRAQLALSWAGLLQRTLPAEMLVLVVQEDNRVTPPWLDEAQSRVAHCDLTNYAFLHRTGQPDAEIVRAAAEHRCDLIIMGGYRHGAVLEWLVGSTVDQVLCHTPLPVLVT